MGSDRAAAGSRDAVAGGECDTNKCAGVKAVGRRQTADLEGYVGKVPAVGGRGCRRDLLGLVRTSVDPLSKT